MTTALGKGVGKGGGRGKGRGGRDGGLAAWAIGGHFGPSIKLLGHFGPTLVGPKYLGAEVSGYQIDNNMVSINVTLFVLSWILWYELT